MTQHTVQPSEFVINWPADDTDDKKHVTNREIRHAMSRVQRIVAGAYQHQVVVVAELRTPLAKAVMEGINKTGTAYASLGNSTFVPEKGGDQSTLYVARNQVLMLNYLDNI